MEKQTIRLAIAAMGILAQSEPSRRAAKQAGVRVRKTKGPEGLRKRKRRIQKQSRKQNRGK